MSKAKKAMTLSVCMIVKDEELNIERALRSVLPVADEVVILDTGSSDRTKEIIQSIDDPKIKLHDHEWKDDFSEARNASIAKCTGDWIFIYDGDEELPAEAQKELRPLLESQPASVKTILLVTRNIITDTLEDSLTMPRIFRKGTISYTFAVHNHPQYAEKTVHTGITLNHYGYQWTPELREKKRKRMMAMMDKILKDDTLAPSEQLYYKAQYYKTLLVCEQKKDAYEYGKALLDEVRNHQKVPLLLHDAFMLLGLQSLEYHDVELARTCIASSRSMAPECPDSYVVELLLANLLKQPLNAHKIFEIYMEKAGSYDKSAALFTVQYEKYHDVALIIGAKAAIEIGLIDQALEILDEAQPTSITAWAADELNRTLAKTQHAKVLQQFEPAILKLTDHERINISQYYSRLYGEINHEMATERKKIAIVVAPTLTSFINGIRHELAKDYIVQTAVVNNIEHAKEYIEWADLVWYEFANELAIAGTHQYPAKQTIVRVHGYEVFGGFVNKVNHDNVSQYIFVADHVREHAQIPEIEDKVTIIHNGVDTSAYTYAEHKPGKKIAFVGNFHSKKNPMLALQILNELVNVGGGDYEFHWAGDMQDTRLYTYITHMVKAMGLQDRFFYHPRVNTNEFLEDKDFFLSTSTLEGYGMAIMEAMSKGIKPIIHNFYVAGDFYPQKYIFNTVKEAVKMIDSDAYDSEEYRAFAESHDENKRQLPAISDVVRNLLQQEVNTMC